MTNYYTAKKAFIGAEFGKQEKTRKKYYIALFIGIAMMVFGTLGMTFMSNIIPLAASKLMLLIGLVLSLYSARSLDDADVGEAISNSEYSTIEDAMRKKVSLMAWDKKHSFCVADNKKEQLIPCLNIKKDDERSLIKRKNISVVTAYKKSCGNKVILDAYLIDDQYLALNL